MGDIRARNKDFLYPPMVEGREGYSSILRSSVPASTFQSPYLQVVAQELLKELKIVVGSFEESQVDLTVSSKSKDGIMPISILKSVNFEGEERWEIVTSRKIDGLEPKLEKGETRVFVVNPATGYIERMKILRSDGYYGVIRDDNNLFLGDMAQRVGAREKIYRALIIDLQNAKKFY